MKIYIIADKASTCLYISNHLNSGPHKAIASELEGSDYKEQLEELKSNKDSFDLFIVVSASPTPCVIEANKLDGVRAVVCRSGEDVSEALAADANVMAFDVAKMSRQQISKSLEELNEGVVEKSKPSVSQRTTDFSERIRQMALQKPRKMRPTKHEELEEDKTPLWDSHKSISKNIKNIFGVE